MAFDEERQSSSHFSNKLRAEKRGEKGIHTGLYTWTTVRYDRRHTWLAEWQTS